MTTATLRASAAEKLKALQNMEAKNHQLNADEWDDWWMGIQASGDDRYRKDGPRTVVFRPTSQKIVGV